MTDTSQQLWIIEDKLAYRGPYCPLHGGAKPSGRLHYAFYNETTGDVWGKRLGFHNSAVWIFTPGLPPDLRLPYEIDLDFLPDQYFEFLLTYLIQSKDLTMANKAVTLHPNNPNSSPGA